MNSFWLVTVSVTMTILTDIKLSRISMYLKWWAKQSWLDMCGVSNMAWRTDHVSWLYKCIMYIILLLSFPLGILAIVANTGKVFEGVGGNNCKSFSKF